MKSKYWLQTAVICALTSIAILIVSFPASSAKWDFSLCDGLYGAAFGLCRSGIAVGCDLDDTQPACSQIAEQFEQITGELPPWVIIARIEPTSGENNTVFTITDPAGRIESSDKVIFYVLPDIWREVDVLGVSIDGTELLGTFSGILNPPSVYGVRVESYNGDQRFPDLQFIMTGTGCPPNCGF